MPQLEPYPGQRDAARAKANAIRCANAEMFRRLGALPVLDARRELIELLLDPDEATGALRVERVLRAVPFWGTQKVTKLLWRAGINVGSKRVRDLTERQRQELAAVVADPRGVWRYSTPLERAS